MHIMPLDEHVFLFSFNLQFAVLYCSMVWLQLPASVIKTTRHVAILPEFTGFLGVHQKIRRKDVFNIDNDHFLKLV